MTNLQKFKHLNEALSLQDEGVGDIALKSYNTIKQVPKTIIKTTEHPLVSKVSSVYHHPKLDAIKHGLSMHFLPPGVSLP